MPRADVVDAEEEEEATRATPDDVKVAAVADCCLDAADFATLAIVVADDKD